MRVTLIVKMIAEETERENQRMSMSDLEVLRFITTTCTGESE